MISAPADRAKWTPSSRRAIVDKGMIPKVDSAVAAIRAGRGQGLVRRRPRAALGAAGDLHRRRRRHRGGLVAAPPPHDRALVLAISLCHRAGGGVRGFHCRGRRVDHHPGAAELRPGAANRAGHEQNAGHFRIRQRFLALRAGRYGADLRTASAGFPADAGRLGAGAIAVQRADPDFLRRLIPVLLLAVAVYVLLKPKLGEKDCPSAHATRLV